MPLDQRVAAPVHHSLAWPWMSRVLMNYQILTRCTALVEINREGGPTRQTALAEYVVLIMCLVTISLNANMIECLLGMMSHAGLPAIQATTLRHRELGTG